MAKQKGPLKVKGSLGDLTFYKSQDGYLVRERGGIDKKRIANDPSFQRTRENNSEFGRAGKAGQLFRKAFNSLLVNSADNRMASRLHRAMVQVIQTDLVSDRGLRNVIDGEAELLKGFEFNIKGKLDSNFFVPYVSAIDRVTGAITVTVPSFVPTTMITAPSGTTHYKIISGGAEIDFENNRFTIATSASAALPWNGNSSAVLKQTNQVNPESTKPLFLVLGIEYYQEVNGIMYPLKNGSYNPLALVDVSGM